MGIVVLVVIVAKITPINRQMILIAVGRDDRWIRTVTIVDVSLKGTADEANIKSGTWR